MRLFVAIDLEGAIRQRIARFMQGVSEFAPDVRWVKTASLHVTIQFIGESSTLEDIQRALDKMRLPATQITFKGTGFFPSSQAPRVFWIGIQADDHLSALARAVDATLASLGIEKEIHAYAPHLTLARCGPGKARITSFKRLQEQLSKFPDPEFGTMRACEFFLYQSKTAPSGAVYTKLAQFALA